MEFDYCLPYQEENNIIYKNSLLINIYILFLCSTMLMWFSFMYRNLEKRCVMLELELQTAYENKDGIEVSSDETDETDGEDNETDESEADNGEVFKRIIETNEDLSDELIEKKQALLSQLLTRNSVDESKLETKSKSDSDLIKVDKNIQSTSQPSYIDTFYSYFYSQ